MAREGAVPIACNLDALWVRLRGGPGVKDFLAGAGLSRRAAALEPDLGRLGPGG
jgi:hypothetical protein